jgi:hypothetical protein
MKRLEKGRVNREKDGVPYPSFSPDPVRNFSDLGQSDDATCFHFEAGFDKEIGICFGKFSGHAPHLFGVRKLLFKRFNVLIDPENNLHGVTSTGCLTLDARKSEIMPLSKQDPFQEPVCQKIRHEYQQVTSIPESQAQKIISSSSRGMTKNVVDFDNLGNLDLAARCRNSKAKTGSFGQAFVEGKTNNLAFEESQKC